MRSGTRVNHQRSGGRLCRFLRRVESQSPSRKRSLLFSAARHSKVTSRKCGKSMAEQYSTNGHGDTDVGKCRRTIRAERLACHTQPSQKSGRPDHRVSRGSRALEGSHRRSHVSLDRQNHDALPNTRGRLRLLMVRLRKRGEPHHYLSARVSILRSVRATSREKGVARFRGQA